MFIDVINYVIAVVFFVCYAYQFLYLAVPFFVKKTVCRCAEKHRYGVLICARNEEKVIGGLIKSIKNQDYPEDLIHIFVCADNCSDKTAEIAEKYGAKVFERQDEKKVGKGYALSFLIRQISRYYNFEMFDGFFVFDADNVLEPDYISEMNKTFDAGNRIVTGYRNSKNYGDNWISAGYSLWFLRESQYLNRPRYLLGTSCAVSGTGFLISRKVLEKTGGWNYFLLTEDIEFTIDSVISGEKIAYCESAVLYDEQPTEFKQSVRQRLRWAKGYIQVFSRYGGRLFKGIFSRRFLSCFDMAMAIMPAMVLSLVSIFVNSAVFITGIGDAGIRLKVLGSIGQSALNIYLTFLIIGAVTLITEWKKIHAPTRKKLMYLPLFPVFMFTYVPISICALFVEVEWKPIAHSKSKSLAEIVGTGISD